MLYTTANYKYVQDMNVVTMYNVQDCFNRRMNQGLDRSFSAVVVVVFVFTAAVARWLLVIVVVPRVVLLYSFAEKLDKF